MTRTTTPIGTTRAKARKPARGGLRAWFHRQTRQAKAAIGIVGALGAMVTGMIAIDSRYASAGDVGQLRQSIERSQIANEIAILNLRKSAVNDRVHSLSAKGRVVRLHPVEQAQLARDQAEVADIDRQIDHKMRQARRQ